MCSAHLDSLMKLSTRISRKKNFFNYRMKNASGQISFSFYWNWTENPRNVLINLMINGMAIVWRVHTIYGVECVLDHIGGQHWRRLCVRVFPKLKTILCSTLNWCIEWSDGSSSLAIPWNANDSTIFHKFCHIVPLVRMANRKFYVQCICVSNNFDWFRIFPFSQVAIISSRNG